MLPHWLFYLLHIVVIFLIIDNLKSIQNECLGCRESPDNPAWNSSNRIAFWISATLRDNLYLKSYPKRIPIALHYVSYVTNTTVFMQCFIIFYYCIITNIGWQEGDKQPFWVSVTRIRLSHSCELNNKL